MGEIFGLAVLQQTTCSLPLRVMTSSRGKQGAPDQIALVGKHGEAAGVRLLPRRATGRVVSAVKRHRRVHLAERSLIFVPAVRVATISAFTMSLPHAKPGGPHPGAPGALHTLAKTRL
jgi:hypothetical protein